MKFYTKLIAITVALVTPLLVLSIQGPDIEVKKPDLPLFLKSLDLPSNYINLKGPVTNREIPRPHINLKLAREEVQKQVAAGSKLITIVIDSPGGAWDRHSKSFINYLVYLKTQGVESRCIVDGGAASMGLIIHSHCSQRLMTPQSAILWHSVRSSGTMSLNVFEAEEFVAELKKMNAEVWARTMVHFDKAYYDHHFKLESWLFATEVIKASASYTGIVNEIVRPVVNKQKDNSPKKKKKKAAKPSFPKPITTVL